MSQLITGDRLRSAIADQTFIKGGDPDSVEAVKYDFHMGSRVLKAAIGQPIELNEIAQEKRWVDPGEVVFVLTKERLELPGNMIATLTPKRKLAHSGIIVLGGLAVDPNYKGVLLVGLYNFSSTPFPLQANKKLIGAVFYELTSKEITNYELADPTEIKDFPEELVALIRNYRPIEVKGLAEDLNETKRQLQELRTELTTDKEWKVEFKQSLDEHNKQLGLLIEGLKDEKEVRRKDDEKIQGKLENMSNWFFALRWGMVAIFSFAGLVVGAAVTYFVTTGLQNKASHPSASNITIAPASSTVPAKP